MWSSTIWISRWGAALADLIVDLGEEKNVAGLSFMFGHQASEFEILHSLGGVDYERAYRRTGNADFEITISSRTPHFKARYVKLHMERAVQQIYHPDDYGNDANVGDIFSVREFEVWEHTGGGGIVGIESISDDPTVPDGMEYMTLAYGLRQPGEWLIASEKDRYTQNLDGGSDPYDVSGYPSMTHIVLTFQKVAESQGVATTEIIMYRNGFQYGRSYQVQGDPSRLALPNKTRLVFGVRSTAHITTRRRRVATGTPDPAENVLHGRTHSPFFDGMIHNVTLIKNALSSEEVRALYRIVKYGGQEAGCHCFDACPTGRNRFFPDVPVPCSGQGACIRDRTQVSYASWGPGKCVCMRGYSGANCQTHCSDLSPEIGCCETDDDCPLGQACDWRTKACMSLSTSTSR